MKAYPKARASRDKKDEDSSSFYLDQIRRELSYRGRRWNHDSQAEKES